MRALVLVMLLAPAARANDPFRYDWAGDSVATVMGIWGLIASENAKHELTADGCHWCERDASGRATLRPASAFLPRHHPLGLRQGPRRREDRAQAPLSAGAAHLGAGHHARRHHRLSARRRRSPLYERCPRRRPGRLAVRLHEPL